MIDPEAEKLINDIRISIQDAHSIMKVQNILFHVEKSNTKAFQLYERLGYKVYRDDGNRYMMIND